MKKKLKTFFINLGDFLNDFLAYAMTVVGVLASNLIPLLNQRGKIKIEMEIARIVLACIVAFMLIQDEEKIDPKIDDNDTEEIKNKKIAEAHAGKRKHLVRRMKNGLSQGVMWTTFIKLGGL